MSRTGTTPERDTKASGVGGLMGVIVMIVY